MPLISVHVTDDEFDVVLDLMRALGYATPGSACRQGLWLLASRAQLEVPVTYFSTFKLPARSAFHPKEMVDDE